MPVLSLQSLCFEKETLYTTLGMVSEFRQIKYLNTLIEQDHRFIKRLTKPEMGFSRLRRRGEHFKDLRR